jgi:hypothetical protein
MVSVERHETRCVTDKSKGEGLGREIGHSDEDDPNPQAMETW